MHTWRFMGGGIAAMMLILLGAPSVAAAVIYGTNGNDRLYGTSDNDSIFGLLGNDLIVGYAGRDYLLGKAGNDTIYGGNETDRIYGGDGDDRLYGGRGIDHLDGGRGNDRINVSGDGGVDWVTCKAGNDVVYLDPEDSAGPGCETKRVVTP